MTDAPEAQEPTRTGTPGWLIAVWTIVACAVLAVVVFFVMTGVRGCQRNQSAEIVGETLSAAGIPYRALNDGTEFYFNVDDVDSYGWQLIEEKLGFDESELASSYRASYPYPATAGSKYGYSIKINTKTGGPIGNGDRGEACIDVGYK